MIAADADRDAVFAAFDVSRETAARIDAIVETLDAWRGRMNLVGAGEWPHIWPRHVADSLQLLPLVEGAKSILDFGSGAGFPGLILAAGLEGSAHVTLVESVGKKCAFLRAASASAGLNVHVVQARIESLVPFDVDVVTARALASLPDLLKYSEPWVSRGAMAIFPKGEIWQEELTQAQQRWTFDHEVILSRTSASGRILKLTEICRV